MILYRYRIKTLDGRTIETVAPTSAAALQQTGIDRGQVRPWYPFPLAVVPDPETQAEIDRKKAERLAYLQDLNRQRRELRNGKGEKKKMAADRWTEQIRHFGAGIGPRIEQTEAGAQVVAPGTPPRTIPMSGLQPKTPQKDGPLPLELAEINAKQQRLF